MRDADRESEEASASGPVRHLSHRLLRRVGGNPTPTLHDAVSVNDLLPSAG